MRIWYLLSLLLLIPAFAEADHACIDGHPMGTQIKSAKPLPKKWFQAGSRDVREQATHSALEKEYGSDYQRGYEEGPVGALCLARNAGYVNFTTSDFGSGVQYSAAAPKCEKCGQQGRTEEHFASGTGLRLGLTKSETSKLLNAKIAADLSAITHEETISFKEKNILHTEVLSLEFHRDRLVRFSIYDYREGI